MIAAGVAVTTLPVAIPTRHSPLGTERSPSCRAEPIQEIVCGMGQPVAGNPTQYIMEKAFAKAGLDWRI